VARVQFGWNAPAIGVPESGGQPIVMQELEHVLPVVAQQLKVGGLVLCNNYRHPTLLAHVGKTLQAFSGGRLILGIGAGWRDDEYVRHGLPFESPAIRIRQLSEAIRLIRSMWAQPRTTFAGTYYQAQGLPCEPKPDPVPPIMVGGGGEKSCRSGSHTRAEGRRIGSVLGWRASVRVEVRQTVDKTKGPAVCPEPHVTC
jgi:hypothetical protein